MSRGPGRPSKSAGDIGSRRRILDQARARFLEDGFAAVSMQQIADAAGITKATMYHHFRSKEELFLEVAQELIDEFWGGAIVLLEADGPLREVLTRVAEYTLANLDRSDFWKIQRDLERQIPPEELRRLFLEHRSPDAALRAVFERGIARGEIRPLDPDHLHMLYGGMVFGLGHGSLGHDVTSELPAAEAARLVVDVLLEGIARRD